MEADREAVRDAVALMKGDPRRKGEAAARVLRRYRELEDLRATRRARGDGEVGDRE